MVQDVNARDLRGSLKPEIFDVVCEMVETYGWKVPDKGTATASTAPAIANRVAEGSPRRAPPPTLGMLPSASAETSNTAPTATI